jgi:histidinol-phosphatase (PHP family)
MKKKREIISDSHIHSPYCGHAHGKIIDYVEVAIQKGMKEICFTDHLGRYYLTESQKKRYWDWGMNEHNLERYSMELEDVKDIFREQITIHTGLEIDYIEGAEDLFIPIIERYNFDFLLGSIHCLPRFGWKHLANYSAQDIWPLFEEYFKASRAIVSSDIFNSLAHIDFIWRYTKWPLKKTLKVFNYIEEIVEIAAAHDMAIEINSNGYLWSQIYTVQGGDPFDILLEKIKKYNTPITIGSDAHKPEFIGKAFTDVAQSLKIRGIREYCTFEKQKKITHPVP